MGTEEGVPYAQLTLDWTCAEHGTGDHEIRSGLFPDPEGYVKGTKTIVTYDVEGRAGSAALDSGHPAFSISQSWPERFWEFFRLGAEHLLTGTDHILFLLALIAGSRRPREVVLAATAFTLAHSVTFLLAALGLVDVSAGLVEPVIALSIAVVAGWHLWRLRGGGDQAAELRAPGGSRFALDRAGWIRLGVVFCFGLVHGLGFMRRTGHRCRVVLDPAVVPAGLQHRHRGRPTRLHRRTVPASPAARTPLTPVRQVGHRSPVGGGGRHGSRLVRPAHHRIVEPQAGGRRAVMFSRSPDRIRTPFTRCREFGALLRVCTSCPPFEHKRIDTS